MKVQTDFFYLKQSFLKKIKRSATSLPASFSAYLKKNISHVILYTLNVMLSTQTDQISLFDYLYFLRCLAKCVL